MNNIHGFWRYCLELIYTLLGLVVLPFVFLSGRLRQGWTQRLGLGLPRSCEIWIQGASAGECTLIPALVQGLQKYSILATSCTQQGLDVLSTIRSDGVFFYRFLPLDWPPLMRWTLARVHPQVVVLVETEIWPGLLLACAQKNIPVLVINGRLSTTSLAGYLPLAPLWTLGAPAQIAAIAQEDAQRFQLVFPQTPVQVTGNGKFDRALDTVLLNQEDVSWSQYLPRLGHFIVLGSVREQEEALVLDLLTRILVLNPSCVLGLFPRHLHRVEHWKNTLDQAGQPYVCLSQLREVLAPGTILLGDEFGQLVSAYALARRAFVGGSLMPLGGQNFLEPLAQGVGTAVGPYERNFSWVGQEIFSDLVFQSSDLQALAAFLTQPAQDRHALRAQVQAYIHARQGATAAHIDIIIQQLTRSGHA